MNKMKLCKVCQKEFAKTAKFCPHCGAKLKIGVLKKVGIGFGVIIVLCLIISIASPKDSSTQSSDNKTTSQSQTPTAQANTQPAKQQDSKPNWNIKEVDATKNGNLQVAVKLLQTAGDIKKNAETPDPATVIKSPWNYYGKIMKVTGTVAVVQDFPTGSDYSKVLDGKDSSDIVITTQDETIVEMLSSIPSGTLKVGNTITLYGYPIGNSEVSNRVGGKDTHLFLVGNSFDKQ